jgi:hypothetical protein
VFSGTQASGQKLFSVVSVPLKEILKTVPRQVLGLPRLQSNAVPFLKIPPLAVVPKSAPFLPNTRDPTGVAP